MTLDQPTPTQPSPRAFATGTGFVFQIVGFGLFLGACCLWSFSGRVFQEASRTVPNWLTYLSGAEAGRALATIGVVTTFLSGLGMVAAGLGLQGERPRSGLAAMIATGLPAAIQAAVCILLIRETGSWISGLVPGLLAILGLVMFLLAGHSRQILRSFPPDPNQSVVSDDFLKELARKRRDRH